MTQDDSSWETWIGEAYAHWRADRYSEALQCCDRAAHCGAPALFAAAMLRGEILLELGDAAGALSSFDTIADVSIPDPDLDCFRGEALFRLARVAEADNALRSAVRGKPELARAWYTLGVIAELRDTGEDVEFFRRARKLDPQSYPMTPRLSLERFNEVVEQVIVLLPAEFGPVLEEVAILVAEQPHLDDLERAESTLSPDSLGALVGLVPQTDPGACNGGSTLPAVLLFKRNLERVSPTPQVLADTIRRVLVLELGASTQLEASELQALLRP